MPQRSPVPVGQSRRFLPEVQALRAVAVLLVIVFHLWPDRLTGGYVGVDVFFVISGFLITAHLLREVEATGRVSLAAFWARRIRRLLPAAILVLLVTLAAVLILLPDSLWQRTVTEIGASALYVQNWVLAASAVDYFAADNLPTAVQHYWSLSVEEQFYLVWPLMLLGLAVFAMRRKVPVRRIVTLGILIVGAASLGYSIWYSYTEPAAAYFSTFTHAWEFASGALLAVASHRIAATVRLPLLRVRAFASILGFALIAASGIAFTGETVFPGFTALVPVVGAMLVIVAGDTTGTLLSPARMLGSRPVQFVGAVSYSAYLWHWPMIVLLPVVTGHELSGWEKIAILVATFVLAALSKRYVEDRLRTPAPKRSGHRFAFATAFVAAAVIVGGCAIPWGAVQARTDTALADAARIQATALAGGDPCLGAGSVLSGSECAGSHTADASLLLATQIADSHGRSSSPIVLSGTLKAEEYGDPDSRHTLALIGDSHAGHYILALLAIARKHDWRLLVLQHNGCTPSAPDWTSSFREDMRAGCQAWRKDLLEVLPGIKGIDEIVTSSVAPRYSRVETPAVQAQVAAAFTRTWRAWSESGKKVTVIADVPGPGDTVGEALDCVAKDPKVDDPCVAPRAEVLEPDPMVIAATATPLAGVTLVDFTRVYCDDGVCHSVVGGLVVYAGGAHLSKLFSLSLAPFIEKSLDRT